MDYIQQAYKNLHDGWRYFVGVLIIFVAWQFIGAIPLIGFLLVEIFEGGTMPTEISGMVEVLGKNLFLFLMLITFAVGLIGIFFSAKVLHKQSILNLTTSRPKIDWKRTFFIFAIWGLFSIGSTLLSYYLAPEDFEVQFNLQPFLILFVITIVLIPLQTSFEEYLFRGYLMQGFGLFFKNRWLPLIITSVGFGLIHGFNPEIDVLGPIVMVFYIGTGLVLGIMTLMDEGLELAIGFHAANNMFIALLITSDWSALQTHAVLKDITDPSQMGIMEIFVPVFVIYPILLLILSKKYGWKNWKEKLFGDVKPLPKEDYKIIE